MVESVHPYVTIAIYGYLLCVGAIGLSLYGHLRRLSQS